MSASHALPIDSAELARTLQAADPAVFLVPARLLRRVIKHDRKMNTIGLQVPHNKSYVIGRDALRTIVDRQDLGVEPDRELPANVILLAQPDPAKLALLSTDEILVKHWRRLFHARVHLALAQRQVNEAGIRQRIERIGGTEFEEVRTVLIREKYLLPPRDDHTTYEEFAAVYLELRYFAGPLLHSYFPNLTDLEAIDALLAEDVDAAGLFASTRLPGAPDPQSVGAEAVREPEVDEEASGPEKDGAEPLPAEGPSPRLLRQVEKARAVGNVVRAAILKIRLATAAGASAAAAEMDVLTQRLQAALSLSDDEAVAWRQALPALLPRAASGFRRVEARLLYDLQKVCVDHERGIYAVDVLEWIRSLGRRPIQRELPGEQEVLILKNLRKAWRRLRASHLAEEDRRRLEALLHEAIVRRERRVRDHFRPLIADALVKVGLVPENLPEQVARDKLTEELLDLVVERGFLNMGDLRDALSRNQLKLPDLSGPLEFLLGDKLIRLNRALAVALDGVYHRGEIYLRWLQRLSSLAFGTRPGRFLTLYLALPFGGAFILLSFITYLFEEFGLRASLTVDPPAAVRDGLLEVFDDLGVRAHLKQRYLNSRRLKLHPEDIPKVPRRVQQTLEQLTAEVWTVFLLGVVLLLLLHVPAVRRGLWQGLKLLGRALRAMFLDGPAWVLRQPPIRAVLDSRPVAFFRRHLFLPLLLTTLTWATARLQGLDRPDTAVLSGFFFVVAALFCNSRLGRVVSETITDWLVLAWQRLSLDLIPALFRFVVWIFKEFLDLVQRLLYTIDEWLRFRRGESRLSLVVKAILCVVWSGVTYVVRFALNLLIEPQINPIKHFPVVTVSHKLLLPLIPLFASFLAATMEWDRRFALTTATAIIFCIPGIFGFMAWELKENWFLYRANRPKTLRPVMIGHHGETMLHLLKPGLHSGTVPKLYASLRRAERKQWAAVRKYRESLQEVEESVRHFVERELVNLLHHSKGWGDTPLSVGKISLATNRIRVELCHPYRAEEPLWLAFDERDGWLLAGVSSRQGWLTGLPEQQRRVLEAALAGLYKMAAVTLVREQIQAALPASCHAYDVTKDGLVVWPDVSYETEVIYNLKDVPELTPRVKMGAPTLPPLEADRLIFGKVPVAWQHWVQTWDQDQAGQELPSPFLQGVSLLPGAEQCCLASVPRPPVQETHCGKN